MPPIRVAHIPGAHPYVRHLASEATDESSAVIVVPDVIPEDRPAGQWWPPVMFAPDWVADNAGAFDVMHLHFGFESFASDHLVATLESLALAGRPLVFTVHDLVNPQLLDQTAHESALDVLIPGADALTTLTAGAAREISARWNREATVIPHPHVLELGSDAVDDIPDPAERETTVITMHLKDLRPNIDAARATLTLVAAVDQLRSRGIDIVAEIHLSDHVRDEAARTAVLEACASSVAVTLSEHPRLSDDALARSLAAADACVLPYSYGTHSGWLELCFDLGVPVVAPALGYYSGQRWQPESIASFEPGSVTSLVNALTRVLDARASSPARSAVRAQRRAGRRHQRELIAQRHLALYREAMARSAGSAPAHRTMS